MSKETRLGHSRSTFTSLQSKLLREIYCDNQHTAGNKPRYLRSSTNSQKSNVNRHSQRPYDPATAFGDFQNYHQQESATGDLIKHKHKAHKNQRGFHTSVILGTRSDMGIVKSYRINKALQACAL